MSSTIQPNLNPRSFLEQLCRQWQRQQRVIAAIRATALAILLLALLWLVQNPTILQLFASGLPLTLLFYLFFHLADEHNRVDARLMTRHLNRVLPELEESAELLLEDEHNLSVLARRQIARLSPVLANTRGQAVLPRRGIWRALAFWLASSTLAVLALLWRDQNDRAGTMKQPANSILLKSTSPSSSARLAIERLQIDLTPPLYTGDSSYSTTDPNVLALAGSTLKWHIKTSKAAGVLLAFASGDTLAMRLERPGWRVAEIIAREPDVYSFSLHDSNGTSFNSEIYSLRVRKDAPPEIIVAAPPQRTIISDPRSGTLEFRAQAVDDFRVTGAQMVATLAKGSGEAVRFREATEQLDLYATNETSRVDLQKNLDLPAFNPAPGDELYFYVEIWDNREPEPNRTRTETFFVLWPDTSQLRVAATTGLLLNPIPEYFRSQRQIIIDTETLLAERSRLSSQRLQRRAQGIAFDQRSLRLRYGQFLGEEVNELDFAGEASDTGHEHEESHNPADTTSSTSVMTMNDVVQQFGHSHDIAENATLFSDSVKAQLKAALAQMWQAESNLHLARLEAALPHEYQALALLKQVQQSSRVYVQRTGFEPPPLKPDDKRLTGDLAEIDDYTITHRKDTPRSSALHDVRRVLQALDANRSQLTPAQLMTLHAGWQELLIAARRDPERYFDALRSLRELLDQWQRDSRVCQECLPIVARACWRLLPAASPVPQPRRATHASLMAHYLQELEARP